MVESLELNPSPSHSPAGWPLATAFTSLNLGFFGSQGWQSHPPHRGVVRERWNGTPFRTRRARWVYERGDAVDTLGACFARAPSSGRAAFAHLRGSPGLCCPQLLLPRGPFAATPPQPAPQRLSTHGLSSSRRGIKHSPKLSGPARSLPLGGLFLLPEMPFPLLSLWSIPSMQLISGATLSRKPSWIPSLSHSSLPGPPRFLSAQLMSPPGRDQLFLIQCPISGHSCNAALAPELGQGQRDPGSGPAGCGVCGSEGPDMPEV